MQFIDITHALCVAAFSGTGLVPQSANDDDPVVNHGVIGPDHDDLMRLEALLMVELAEDDIDHHAYTADLHIVRHRLEKIHGPKPRPRPRLFAV